MASAAEESVKVVGLWPSPFVLRVCIALNIKFVHYQILEETFGEKSELLLKSNPIYKKVPVLLHNDKPICESMIIVQYIDEFWASGPSILPADPFDRSVARFWASYIDDKWFTNLRAIGAIDDEEARKATINEVEQGLGLLEGAFQSCSRGKKFFGGDTIGYLDIALGCNLGWIKVYDETLNIKLLDEAKFPGLAKWAHNFCADSAVVDVMPSTHKLAEFGKILFAALKANPTN